MAYSEPVPFVGQEVSLEEGIDLYFRMFDLQHKLDSQKNPIFAKHDPNSGPDRELQLTLRSAAGRLRRLWEHDSIQHLREFRSCYGLDSVDIDILMHVLYEQSKAGASGFSGREMDGASILSLPTVECPRAFLTRRIMQGSPLVDNGLIQLFGPTNESVLMKCLRIPDNIILELTTEIPCGGGSPASDAQDRRPQENADIAETREPRFKMGDVVLSGDQKNRLQAMLAQHGQSRVLLEEWGLGEVARYGRGATILLYGPPGTGKTMLGEAIAGELGISLIVARFPGLEGGIVGDTEKNIARLFAFAKKTRCVLMVDECDAVLCKRLSGNRSNDRFFNQQFLVFCQEIEKFDGVLILTTNRAVELDEALDRRIALKLEMGLPGEQERVQIWDAYLARIPLTDDVDVGSLSRRFAFSGGYIKNAVFAAARRAIVRAEADSRPAIVTMDELAQAASEETSGFREAGSSGKIGFRTQ